MNSRIITRDFSMQLPAPKTLCIINKIIETYQRDITYEPIRLQKLNLCDSHERLFASILIKNEGITVEKPKRLHPNGNVISEGILWMAIHTVEFFALWANKDPADASQASNWSLKRTFSLGVYLAEYYRIGLACPPQWESIAQRITLLKHDSASLSNVNWRPSANNCSKLLEKIPVRSTYIAASLFEDWDF